MSHPIKSRTLSAAIADQLRRDILAGRHAAGVQLRQDVLAHEFAVSRIPVREALFQLEAEGLVQIAPHKGAVVSGLSHEEIEDVFALRILLEPRLLLASSPLLSTAQLDAAAAFEAAFAEAVRRQEADKWGGLNAAFHLKLYEAAGLPRSLSIVEGLLKTSERYTSVQLLRSDAGGRVEAEHVELLRLVHLRDAEAACALLIRHIAAVRDDLVAVI
jgi:DNA-binding GntR family transcriptional regulator